MKNILLVGGLGYIGSGLRAELQYIDAKVHTVDLNLFDTEYDSENEEVVIADFLEVYKDYDLNSYDYIIWTMDIDNRKWFCEDSDTKVLSENYTNKNIEVFSKVCNSKARVIFITEDPAVVCVENKEYIDFLKRKQFIAINETIYFANEVFGVSNRMRFDTMINRFFFQAFVYGQIYIDEPIKTMPAISLFDFAKTILEDIKSDIKLDTGIIHKIASYTLNGGSYASLVRYSVAKHNKTTADNIGTIFSDAMPTIGENDRKLMLYKEPRMSMMDIDGFVRDISRYSSSGEITVKDNYDNSKIFINAKNYTKVCKFFRSLE